MARIFRALLIAAVNAIQEFFAFATKECLEYGLKNITNNGCTDLGNGLYQGGNGKSLKMSDILPITNANSWEFQTRYTYKASASQCTLLGYIDPESNDYKTPWIFIQNNIMYLRINNMGVWQSTFILEIDKTYDIKVGFTGTAYYIDAKLDTDENYTNYLTQSSTTKQNNTAPIMLMDLGYRTHVNQYYNNGIIDMTRTKFIIDDITTYFWSEILNVGDNIKLNDGMATSNYDWSAYPSNTNTNGTYTQTGTIESIKQINDEVVYATAEPEQDNKDATINTGKIYHAYTNANDESVYTNDNPISESPNPSILYDSSFQELNPQPEFSVLQQGLVNATEYGTLTNNNGVYSGFNSSNFIYLNTITPQTSMDFIIKCNPSTGYGDLLRTQPDGRGILLRCTSSSASCYLSSSGSGWNVLSGFSTGLTFTANTDTYVRITWNSSNGVYTFWQSSDGQNWTERNSSSSGLAAPYWNSGNQTIGACSSYSEHWYGSVDMKETKLIIDANTINFYNTLNGIIINSDNYIKTSDNDLIQPITATIETVDNTTINSVFITSDQTATIETAANITTSNNDNVITDGSYHLFNLTVPTSMTSIIESSGISYQTNEMPLLLKNGVGVGLLLKNGNNVYYRNTWIINRDYDLHFQEIRFVTNVQNPTITLKINNVLTSAPYYTYAGDKIEYIISKEGYCDYSGSFITSYTSKDGKIITIDVELTASNGTVDVSNYEYTLNNQGNMILTKYKGGTDTVVPNV